MSNTTLTGMDQWLTSAAGGTVGGAVVSLIYFLVTHAGCRCHRSFTRGLSFDFKYNRKHESEEAEEVVAEGEEELPSAKGVSPSIVGRLQIASPEPTPSPHVWQAQKSLQQELYLHRQLLQEGLVYQNDEEEDQTMTEADPSVHVPSIHPTGTITSPLIGQFLPGLLVGGAIAGATSMPSTNMPVVEECVDMNVDKKVETD